MSGGAYEDTMANIVSNDGTAMIPSSSGYTKSPYPNSKYYDKYSFSKSAEARINSKLGDGIKEVYKGSNAGWCGDNSTLAYSGASWFVRGGYYDRGAYAGAFNSNYIDGSAGPLTSSRLVITP